MVHNIIIFFKHNLTMSKLIYLILTVILASCVFNFFLAPYFECVMLYVECENVINDNPVECTFTWSLCIACFMSLVVLWVKYRSAKTAYDRLMESHDAYSPTTAAERKNHATFTIFIFVTCITVMLPVNIHRLFTLYTSGKVTDVIVYFFLIYSHNAIICMMEMHFVALCHALYRKFVTINRDIQHIDDDIADGCPPYLQATMAGPRKTWIACRGINDCRDYCYYSRTTGHSLADGVERLKIRHRLIREALDHLNRAFAIPLGLALCNLCVMTLFDIFYYVTNDLGTLKINVYICLWITQYTFRFSIIVMIVHATTKQASDFFRQTVFSHDYYIGNRYS